MASTNGSNRASQAREWKAAQAMKLSVPSLAEAAKQQLNFLARVHQDQGLTQAGLALDLAIYRYESCWLPLLANQVENGQSTALVPPLDCAWVWHCHRLNPIQYAQDCKSLYARVLGATTPEPGSMVSATEMTIHLWRARYPNEPYNHHQSIKSGIERRPEDFKRVFTYNLADAVLRQTSFYYQVSQPHWKQAAFLQAAEMRYKGFLHLAAKSKGKLFLVPTYDIDLVWHTHQLDPIAYRIDTLHALGKVLNHDDTDSDRHEGSKLSTSFQETKLLWEEIYSIPYEKAGAMYRGIAPTSLMGSYQVADLLTYSKNTSDTYKQQQEVQSEVLAQRESVQVYINILGVKNVPLKRAGPLLFVRMRPMRNAGKFQMNTAEVETSALARWNQAPWMLNFETSVEGIVLELRTRKTCLLGGLKKSSQLLGEVQVPFRLLLASPTLSALDWLSLHKDEQIWDLNNKPPALEIAASITPPLPSPYLLRGINAKTTDDNFQDLTDRWRHIQMGRWLTRSVLDHKGKDIFTVRIRKLKGCRKPTGSGKDCLPVGENERIVDVYRPNTFAKPGEPPVVLAASAKQLMDTLTEHEEAKLQRQWALFDPTTVFTVRKNSDPKWDEYPELTLEGNVGYPVGLVSGRWLQYQVRDCKPEDECGYVTLIRYTPECPTGKATALFNWKSAAMEVTLGENAVLVVLLSTVTALAVHDLLGTMSRKPVKVTKKKMFPNKADWGAVIVESAHARRPETCPSGMLSQFWWTLNSQQWMDEVYETGSKSAADCGGAGACGGGACSSGRSGGASCGGGAGCGGGCLGGGCGGGR